MDVAREAFVRYLALEKWREIRDTSETLGVDWTRAALESARFPGRGSYQALWVRRWQEHLTREATAADAGALFAAIERAVAAALHDEEEERKRRGAPSLDEDPEYRTFVGRTLERLRQAGELEPF
jgi:hypothetical protein